MDAGGVGVTASSVRTVTVVDWLTLVSVLPPSCQTLAGVSPRSRLYTFSLQRAPAGTKPKTTTLDSEASGRMSQTSVFIKVNTQSGLLKAQQILF